MIEEENLASNYVTQVDDVLDALRYEHVLCGLLQAREDRNYPPDAAAAASSGGESPAAAAAAAPGQPKPAKAH